MKINYIDENNIIVFLNKIKIKDKLLLSSSYLENYFRNLFLILKEKYQINISGYCNVTLYQDNIYGVIVDIKREFTDYFDYFDNQVDMKIDIAKNTVFLYKVNALSNLCEKDYSLFSIYLYNDNIYLKPKKSISQLTLGSLIENCTIVYGDLCNKVLKYGKKIKSKYIFV